jgi:hypothetical protein
VGTGRDARGERLSGHQFIRVQALGHLLVLLRAQLSESAAAALDDLDLYRRFEVARPELGRELEAALRQPAVYAAKALLEIAARETPELVPARARGAVARALDTASRGAGSR